ncbi:hypothetical protein Dimus_026125 [Dionaea muscipula]
MDSGSSSTDTAAESSTETATKDVILSIAAAQAAISSNNTYETLRNLQIPQVGFGIKSPDKVPRDHPSPNSPATRPESLSLGTQMRIEEGTKLSPTTSPGKPPRPPNEAVARRPSRTRSSFLRAKSRLVEVEPPYAPIPTDASLEEESTTQPVVNAAAAAARSPYRDSPRQTPSRVSVSTPKAVQGDDDEEEEDEEVYKATVQANPKSGKKLNLLLPAILEWTMFVALTALLVASLIVHPLIEMKLWSLELWKWCVLAMVMFCGQLINEWCTNGLVFLLERNFPLKSKVLYFVYGMKRSVQVFFWLASILVAWVLLFNHGVKRSRRAARILHYITMALAGFVVGAGIWLAKTLFIKTVAVAFHVERFFERIRDSLFHQYVLQALSGPPLKEEESEQDGIGIDRPTTTSCTASGKMSFRRKKGNLEEVIDIDRLNRMKQEKVSAWTMRGLIKVITGTKLSTISCTLDGDQTSNEITSEREAKFAASRIFENLAKPGHKYIEEEDLRRFMKREVVEHVFPLLEGETKTGKIKKASLTKWVVDWYLERKVLAHSLNDTKTAVEELNRIASGLVLIVNIIVWNLMMGFFTTKILVFISSQLLLVVFMFGNTVKMVFEALIFVFIMHPFDVGDRCVIDGVQMVVEEMNILTTIFLRYDNEKIIYPNSVLATKPISNFYRSPEMCDSVEFAVHFSTSAETISALKARIKLYLESKKQHWRPIHSLVVKEIEDMNKMKMCLYVNHTINFQNVTEKNSRRCDLLMELKKIFEDLGIKYHLLPQEVYITYVGSPESKFFDGMAH